MGEVAYTAAATMAAASSSPVKEEEEERYVYVQAASRFFRVKPGRDGAVTPRAHHHHFLDACFLCKKSISSDQDIFMYKGDAAFCGEECRQEQMSMDEALQAVARRHRAMLQRRPAAAMTEPAAGTAQREVEASTPMMRRRPTIANIGAARTPVAAS